MSSFMHTYLLAVLIALALLLLASLVYAILGRQFTDKIVATNLIGSLGVGIIAILAVFLGEDYILDVSLVFAMLSFLAVIVLCRFAGHNVLRRMRRRRSTAEPKEEEEK